MRNPQPKSSLLHSLISVAEFWAAHLITLREDIKTFEIRRLLWASCWRGSLSQILSYKLRWINYNSLHHINLHPELQVS